MFSANIQACCEGPGYNSDIRYINNTLILIKFFVLYLVVFRMKMEQKYFFTWRFLNSLQISGCHSIYEE